MIWCVEDDASIRDIEIYALRAAGFEVQGFPDGDSFWDALQQQHPDLVVLDVMLPGADGTELLRRMRATPSLSAIPVILATARGAEYDRISGLDSGADDYLVKPFSVMELASRVRAVLRRCKPPAEKRLTCGGLTLNEQEHTVAVNGRRVELTTPQRGAKMDLIRLADQNAREEVVRATTREERQNKLLELLGQMLCLPAPPRRMESYDISNTGASDIVASMVVYQDGRPLKRDYRRFKLKDMTGPNDYASMEQILSRRFRRYLDGDERFSSRPDLLLIDGGLEHVRVAARVLESMNLPIPAFGMVKDDRHRTRALVHPDGREIGIQAVPAVFALIGQIQEETHRFAIEYHRQLQAGRVKTSVLDQISGVGPVRRQQLLQHFKSIKAIRAASLEQLAEVVPQNTAQAVYLQFHKESAPAQPAGE